MDVVIDLVRAAAEKRILFLPHAITQMVRAGRMISPEEVISTMATPDMVEDYPDDPRGHSCLILGRGDGGRPIHVVCSPKKDYLAVITAYLPDPGQWSADLKKRRK